MSQTAIAQNQAFTGKSNWMVTTGVYCLSTLVVILTGDELVDRLFGNTQPLGCFRLIAVARGQRSQKKLVVCLL